MSKYLIIGHICKSHNIPLYYVASSLIQRGHDVTFCISEDSKYLVKEDKIEVLLYPKEAQLSFYEKLNSNLKANEEGLEVVLNHHAGITDFIINWFRGELKNNKIFDGIIYDCFSIWAIPIAKILNLKLISSHPSSIVDSTGFIAGKNNKNVRNDTVNFFNKKYEAQLKDQIDLVRCSYTRKKIIYNSKYFQGDEKFFQENELIHFANFDALEEKYFTKCFNTESLIYISLGTTFNNNPKFFENAVEIFKELPNKVVVSAGGSEELFSKINKNNCPKNVSVLPWVNQEEILKNASIFITHGGGNSAREAIRFCTPVILCPQAVDQFAISRRLVELGAGKLIDSDCASLNLNLVRALEELKSDFNLYYENIKNIKKSFLNSMDQKMVAIEIENFFKN